MTGIPQARPWAESSATFFMQSCSVGVPGKPLQATASAPRRRASSTEKSIRGWPLAALGMAE